MAGLAAEACPEERAGALDRELDRDDPRTEAQDVHVVVLHALARRVRVVADRGADAAHLGRCDGRPDAAAADEDAPVGGIFLVVLVAVVASVVSLFVALSDAKPDAAEVALSVASVVLGWFTVQAVGAFHYAYEYYQAPEMEDSDKEIEGGLDFPGGEDPDGTAFMYFSYTVGTSVATSDTKITSNAMRRRLTYHLVFSHLYNTIILAATVNVIMALGGGG